MSKRIKYTKELLEENVKDCFSFSELCKRLGLAHAGSNPKTLRRKLNEFGVDYSHFTGQNWNSNSKNPVYIRTYTKSLSENSSLSSGNTKKLLFRLGLKTNKCECCGLTEWLGKPISCELHHINGDHTDNRIENLIILCPNCHSQTDNYAGRKNKKGVNTRIHKKPRKHTCSVCGKALNRPPKTGMCIECLRKSFKNK